MSISMRINSATDDSRMGIVELDRHFVGQDCQIAVLLQMAAHDVLQRGRGEEILLAQPQFLAGRRRISRIEHPGQAFGLVAFAQRADMVAGIERIEQDRVDRLGSPQAQRVDALRPPADDRRVKRDGNHALGWLPHMDALLVAAGQVRQRRQSRSHRSSRGARIPRDCRGPAMSRAIRPASRRRFAGGKDHAHSGCHSHRRECRRVAIALHEAGGQPPEAAIAQRRIGLKCSDHVDVDAKSCQRLAHLVHQLEIAKRRRASGGRSETPATDNKRAWRFPVGLARRFHPAVDDPVANDENGGDQPVVGLGDLGDPCRCDRSAAR